MREQILIVDRDPIHRRALSQAIMQLGFTPVTVQDGETAVNAMIDSRHTSIRLAILDLILPDMDGIAVLQRLAISGHPVPVIVQIHDGGLENVGNALRAGAADFVIKPVHFERLQATVRNTLQISTLRRELAANGAGAPRSPKLDEFVAHSPAMERVLGLAARAAASSLPVLIEGESGVGKALVARAIHHSSARRSRKFIAARCNADTTETIASVVHEAGSGTLFLSDICDLSSEAQMRLLEVLDKRRATKPPYRPSTADFRLIGAARRNLIDQVKTGKFREDLYYRLNISPIRVPPLRERPEDLPELIRQFIARFSAELNKNAVIDLAPEARAMLRAYSWPGNVRQLENTLYRAVALCRSGHLTVDAFPQIAAATRPALTDRVESQIEPQSQRLIPRMAGKPIDSGHNSSEPPFGFARSLEATGHVRALAEVEREMIKLAIAHYGGRMAEVARRLQIGRSTLYRKLKDYGLDDAPAPVPADRIN